MYCICKLLFPFHLKKKKEEREVERFTPSMDVLLGEIVLNFWYKILLEFLNDLFV